jgi:vacuolar-type H+-ATPase subunit I/STV1
MKIAVIIAIVHMSVGVVIKYFNAQFFKRKLETFFEFIPQILFLGLLFGYMDFLIIYKWLTNWGCVVRIDPITGSQGIECVKDHLPPSIISTMMDIGLKVGSTVNIY